MPLTLTRVEAIDPRYRHDKNYMRGRRTALIKGAASEIAEMLNTPIPRGMVGMIHLREGDPNKPGSKPEYILEVRAGD